MGNEQFVTCFYCNRILYFVPPPPKEEEAAPADASKTSREKQESVPLRRSRYPVASSSPAIRKPDSNQLHPLKQLSPCLLI